MNSIFDYIDYRKYLKDFYTDQKTRKTGFTYKKFSEKSGIKSPNMYKLVMDGEKNLTDKTIPKFCKGLELSVTQSNYFQILVFYTQSSEATERGFYHQKLRELKDLNMRELKQTLVIEEDRFQEMSNWLFNTLISLVQIRGFKEDTKWIKERIFNLADEKVISEAIKVLVDIGALTRDKKGNLIRSTEIVFKKATPTEESVQQFYKSLAVRSVAAYNLSQGPELVNACIVTSINRKSIEKIREKVQKFIVELNEEIMEENGDEEVYTVKVFGFPVSKRADEEY